RDALKLAVSSLVREVDGVADAGHWLDADEVAIRRGLDSIAASRARRGTEALAAASSVLRMRRPDHHRSKIGTEHHVEPLRFPNHRHRRPALLIALEIRKHIVEVVGVE